MAGRTPAQTFALVVGVVYLAIGVIGFAFSGFDDFADANPDNEMLGFHINGLHNLVHIAIGAVLIGAASAHASAKSANLVVGVVLLLVALIGFIEKPTTVLEWLNIFDGSSDPDNFLHLVTGAAGVLFGTVAAEATTRSTAA